MTIRSKHSNVLNYFIHDRRDLSPAYVRGCEKFLKSINKQRAKKNSRLQLLKSLDEAASSKRHEKDTIMS